jgi:hypothetical protein
LSVSTRLMDAPGTEPTPLKLGPYRLISAVWICDSVRCLEYPLRYR